jgi:hypothetical protein
MEQMRFDLALGLFRATSSSAHPLYSAGLRNKPTVAPKTSKPFRSRVGPGFQSTPPASKTQMSALAAGTLCRHRNGSENLQNADLKRGHGWARPAQGGRPCSGCSEAREAAAGPAAVGRRAPYPFLTPYHLDGKASLARSPAHPRTGLAPCAPGPGQEQRAQSARCCPAAGPSRSLHRAACHRPGWRGIGWPGP